VVRNGHDLYLKAMEKLEVYACTMYKNGANIQKSLKQYRRLTFTPPELLKMESGGSHSTINLVVELFTKRDF